MSTLVASKLAINIVSSLGVAKIVGDIIKNNVVVLTTSQKVMVNVGGAVIASMIVEQAINHVNAQIDELVEAHHKSREEEKVLPAE